MKNTMVEDLFKVMDKAIILSKPISDMTDEEQKTFNDKLQELELLKRVNIFTEDYITTMKDNRGTCDEEQIDITEVMDKNAKLYMNNELVKFLQDYVIKDNKIKIYEAGTIKGLKKIIDLVDKCISIKIKHYDNELVIAGMLRHYKFSYDGIMFNIEYTIDLNLDDIYKELIAK